MVQTASVKTYTQQNAAGNAVIFAQRYGADQAKIGDPIQVTSDDLDSYSVESTTLLTNGGIVVTYAYDDPAGPTGPYGAPITYLTATTITPDNQQRPGTFNVSDDADSWTNASSQTVALSGGAYATVLSTSMTQTDVTTKKTVLNYVDGSGAFTSSKELFESDGNYGPYPYKVYDSVSLTHNADATFTVSYTDHYESSGDPPPQGEQTYTYVYRDDDTLKSMIFIDTDGTKTYDAYDSFGRETSSLVQSPDGISEATYYGTNGQPTSIYTRYADGSRTVSTYGITGEPYAQQTASYDASGKQTYLRRAYANGKVSLILTTNADGSQLVRGYDTSDRQTTNIAIAADSSREVRLQSYSGTSTTPTKIEDDAFGTDQKILSSDISTPNGPHTKTAYAAGVVLTSTTGAADTLKGSAAGGDTFAFNPAFGQDLVTNFRAGAAHNTIQFDASIVADFAHLQPKISATDAGALITIDASNSILLKGVSAASLTSSDFTFKPRGLA